MDLELTDDQAELRAIAKDLFERRGDLAPARELLEHGRDDGALAAEISALGWAAVGLEEHDPFGVPGLCVLAEQVGAHVAPVGLVDATVAARLAAGLSDPPAGRPAALCVLEEAAGWSTTDLAATAVADGGDAVRINGRKLGVHHGATAGLFVFLAVLGDEPTAVLVPSDVDGIRVEASESLDPSSSLATVTFENVEAPASALVGGCRLHESLQIGTVATAAEAVGAASRALDMAVGYALERHQFGRSIGSFQSLQHRLADMYVKREASWSTVLYAAAALDEGLEEAPTAVSIAKAYVSRTAREIVEGALQILGGIGFTWEHDAHLLQRRVLECERRFGDTIDHENRLARTGEASVAAARAGTGTPAGSLARR